MHAAVQVGGLRLQEPPCALLDLSWSLFIPRVKSKQATLMVCALRQEVKKMCKF